MEDLTLPDVKTYSMTAVIQKVCMKNRQLNECKEIATQADPHICGHFTTQWHYRLLGVGFFSISSAGSNEYLCRKQLNWNPTAHKRNSIPDASYF